MSQRMYKDLLSEAYTTTKKMTGNDPCGARTFKRILADDAQWDIYIRSLTEGLSDQEACDFALMAKNERRELLESSTYQFNPFETLAIPVLRVYYPKLIAKELVNVVPIDKPEVMRPFLRANFKRSGDSTYDYAFPSVNTDISRGPSVGVTVTATATEGETDVLAVASLTSTTSHIERDFVITKVTDSTGNETSVTIRPDVDGNFNESVTVAGVSAYVSGGINYKTGILVVQFTGDLTSVDYEAYCSLEEQAINPMVDFTLEKIPLRVIDRQITGNWSIQMQQDTKQLYDIDIQAEFVNIIGEQIALDIDREIITALINNNTTQNPATHTQTFDKNPDSTFVLGRKAWYENILVNLTSLSARVYNSTYMGSANTIACNPEDASILENLNSYEFGGNSVEGGALQYRATVGNGKWNVLVSSAVPSGKMILKYRSNDVARAVYIYSPYVPALLHPYPLGSTPNLSILTRYARQIIRPEGVAVLNIVDTA